MAEYEPVTRVGTVVATPELKFVGDGKAVANFELKVTKGKGDARETTFYSVAAWEQLAENVAASIQGGDRVIVYGKPGIDTWIGQDGTERSKRKITGWSIGPSLEYASCEVARVERSTERPNVGAAATAVGADF